MAFATDMEDFAKGMIKPIAALAVVVLAIALSLTQNLRIVKDMAYAVSRSFLQLSIVGFVLQFVFVQGNPLYIILAYFFMVAVAGYTAGQRANHVPYGKYIAGISILVGTSITMVFIVILKVFPFTPRYIIPVAGTMVGYVMTTTGVTLKRLCDDIRVQLNLVETALALGATPRQATIEQVRRALVLALAPGYDTIKTFGIITFPGTMTGLIMSGASPLEAIQLQMVVLTTILGASTFSCFMSTYLSWPFFFTKTYQIQSKVFVPE